MRRGHYIHFFLLALNIQLIDYVGWVVVLETFEFLLSDQLVLPEVYAFFLPLFALLVVYNKLSIRLVVRKESEFAVPIETCQLALVPFCLTLLKTAFLDVGDPLVVLSVRYCRVNTSLEASRKGSEIHEAPVPVEGRRDIVPEQELVLVRIEHLRLPVADPVHRQLMCRVEHHFEFWVFDVLDVDPDIDELGRAFLQLYIFERVELLFICSQSSLESRHEVFQVRFNILLQTIFSALETLDEDGSAENLAA